MKLFNNKSNRLATVLTIAFVIGAAFAAQMIPADASAAGPVFGVFPIGYNGSQNEDYPLLDARNFSSGGSFSTSQSDHDNGVTVDPGQTVEVIVYYHNGAADAEENTARNVRVAVSLPSGTAQNHTLSATISASNAATVTSSQKGGDMTVKINTSAQRLEYIPGSTMWFPNRSTSGQSLPDGITSGGVTIGDVRGCWQYAGFVKFRARVTQDQTSVGALQITKSVQNITTGGGYSGTVDAQPSDIVRFRVVTSASGGSVQEVFIRDILPSGLSYRSGTTRVNGSTVSDSTDFFGSGYSYGTLASGAQVEITFEAQVASSGYFSGSGTTLTNTANARGRDVSTVQATAQVRVGSVAGSSFQLAKSAYNQTQGVNATSVLANPGDVINYTLTYRNTGGTTISNVVIEDDLSDVLRLADMINPGEGYLSGNVIRFPSISVPAGVSIDKTFQVRIRDVVPSQTNLSMTNIYGNSVTVQVRPPIVKGTYIAPKTGPEDWIVPALAALATLSVFVYRRRAGVTLSA